MDEKTIIQGDLNMADDKDKELLIRLETKVDAILESLKQIPKIEERVRCVENKVVSIDDMKKDIEKLENKSNTWSILNSVGVFLAALIGSVFGGK